MKIWVKKKKKMKKLEKGKIRNVNFFFFSNDFVLCPCIAVFCTFFVPPFWFQTGLCDFCSTGGVIF